jgi:CBS domain-containing protein
MYNFDVAKKSGRELIDGLKAARDTARLHVHLLSLDARQRFRDVESKLEELERELERGSVKAIEQVPPQVKEIGQAIADLLRDAEGSRELATPVLALMTSSPATCSPRDSLNLAAQIMWERDCGSVPVVDSDGRLLGVVTDRDICMATYTRGQPLWAMSVLSTMSPPPISASPTDTVGYVLKLMSEGRVRRIPITENDRLVGVVALADIARHVRNGGGDSLPAVLAIAHTLADISQET